MHTRRETNPSCRRNEPSSSKLCASLARQLLPCLCHHRELLRFHSHLSLRPCRRVQHGSSLTPALKSPSNQPTSRSPGSLASESVHPGSSPNSGSRHDMQTAHRCVSSRNPTWRTITRRLSATRKSHNALSPPGPSLRSCDSNNLSRLAPLLHPSSRLHRRNPSEVFSANLFRPSNKQHLTDRYRECHVRWRPPCKTPTRVPLLQCCRRRQLPRLQHRAAQASLRRAACSTC